MSWSERYGVSIQIGAPERGETTKTSPRQGVRPDRPEVERLVLHHKAEARRVGRRRLFSIYPQQFYVAWVRACQTLGYNPGPPHSLRHTGASFDALEDLTTGKCYRDLRGIQVRGKWKMDASVQLYSKTHVYLRALGEMPTVLAARGAQLYLKLKERPSFAKL